MARPVHRDQVRTFVWGCATIAIALLIAFVGVRVQGGGTLPGKSYTYVTAKFRDIGMLNPRSEVTRGGVRVGQVTSTRYTSTGALVTMRLDGHVDVYRNASATIQNKSALGRKTVDLKVGTKDAGDLGDATISLAQTNPSTALDDALAAFDPKTRARLHETLVATGAGLAGHSEDLSNVTRVAPELLDDAGSVTKTLASPDTDLAGLLRAADTFTGRFQGRTDQLAELMDNLNTTLEAVNADGGKPLSETLDAAPGALHNARVGLDAVRPPLTDVRKTVERMHGGIDGLVKSETNLRGFLRESTDPLDRLPGVSKLATPAVENLTGLLTDLRPLVPSLVEALDSASTLLNGLSPYSVDIGNLAAAHTMLSGRVAQYKHYFSAMLVFPGLYSAGLPDPVVDRVPYPKPGGGAIADNPWRKKR